LLPRTRPIGRCIAAIHSFKAGPTCRQPARPELLWTFKAGKPIKAPAAISQGRVIVGDDAGVVHALDLVKGTESWTFKTEGPIEAAPLVLEGVVYIGSSDGRVYALDAASGTPKWKYETNDKVLGGANYVKNPDGGGWWIIVGSYDMLLHCIDPATGKMLWTVETENYINGTPLSLPRRSYLRRLRRLHPRGLSEGAQGTSQVRIRRVYCRFCSGGWRNGVCRALRQ
jgi:outer membrane protein assembly factor BamB